MKALPPDIEYLINDEGIFIEIESFIRFLKNNDNISDEYQSEARHLVKMAEYLEEQLAEIISQKSLISGIFNTDKPN